MPVVNPLARELVFKVVYYGPGLGGKTTTLQHVHATAKPEHRGKMVSLATPVDRTLYFDFLPIRVPHVRGMGVRLQLFTVPGQVHYNATRKLVLTGVDGIVMVFDSQRAREDANLETLENLKDNLAAHGKSLSEVPHVVQYNKRDLYDVMPIDELERQLNRHGAPSFATVATGGEGVYESLEAITRAVMDDFDRRLSLEAPAAPPVHVTLPAVSGGSGGPAAPTTRRATSEPPLSHAPAPSSRPPAAATIPTPGAFSFGALFSSAEQGVVQVVESALALGDPAAAIGAMDQLVARALASGAALAGSSHDAPRDPALVALLLGIEPRRYLKFRGLVREARAGTLLSVESGLLAYAFVLDLRRALRDAG
jgi:mutual gliding-motility protein MglA